MRVTAEMLDIAGWSRYIANLSWCRVPVWQRPYTNQLFTFHEAAAIYKQQREKKDVLEEKSTVLPSPAN